LTGNFADNGYFHAIAGIFYMPQICEMGSNGFTLPPNEGMLRIFRPQESDGFGRVRTRELGYQMLTSR
jgi:hypothetical protein